MQITNSTRKNWTALPGQKCDNSVQFVSENADKVKVKNTGSDRKWIGLIVILLIAEILWLLVDLNWVHIPYFAKESKSGDAKEAGYIISSKKELKRRGANSLIWEDTQPKDILFYYDSILTLSQSSAKLYLKDQTDLELSENTLVTLEEPGDKSKSEITLRFSRGDLRARNPSFKTAVVGEDWVVNLDKGSDILLRKDENSYEFEVVSGSATLQTKNGEQNLTQDKILKLNSDQQIEAVAKSKTLKWNEKKPVRIYTLQDKATVSLAWSGEAESLVISKAGMQESLQPVASHKSETAIKLDYGSYKIRLKSENGVSEAKTVEVWKAPHIYLKKPLPRDRIATHQMHEFIWTTEQGIKTYKIKFMTPGAPTHQENVNENFMSVKFDKESDIQWQVEGEDDEGFVIPPLYDNSIYIRDEPLKAPKLKAPDIKKEDPPTGAFYHRLQWLIHVFMSSAQAKENNYEVNFSWEPVVGADQYILEVSSTPDFREPELIKKLSSTSYRWKKVRYKKYYWRVASGNANGRMGLFSEPLELQLEELKISDKPSQVVNAEPIHAKPNTSCFKEEPVVQPEPALEALQTESPQVNSFIALPSIPSGFSFALAPSYKYSKTSGEQEAHVDLQGVVLFGFQLDYKTDWVNTHNYHLSLWTSSQTWKPTPKSEYPLQEDIKVRESLMIIDRGTVNQKIRWGLVAHENFIPQRQSAESVTVQSEVSFGIRASRLFDVSDTWQNNLGISLLTSGKVHEVMLNGQAKWYPKQSDKNYRWMLGAGVNVVNQSYKKGDGLQSDIIFLFGYEPF